MVCVIPPPFVCKGLEYGVLGRWLLKNRTSHTHKKNENKIKKGKRKRIGGLLHCWLRGEWEITARLIWRSMSIRDKYPFSLSLSHGTLRLHRRNGSLGNDVYSHQIGPHTGCIWVSVCKKPCRLAVEYRTESVVGLEAANGPKANICYSCFTPGHIHTSSTTISILLIIVLQKGKIGALSTLFWIKWWD